MGETRALTESHLNFLHILYDWLLGFDPDTVIVTETDDHCPPCHIKPYSASLLRMQVLQIINKGTYSDFEKSMLGKLRESYITVSDMQSRLNVI